MLQPIMHILASQRIILASGSPRRKQILENVGLQFEVIPSTFEENLDKSSFALPYDYVKETARRKAMEVLGRLANDKRPPDLIISADTVVTMDDIIHEKPSSEDHAYKMLSSFSGRTHTVYTGVTLVTAGKDSSGPSVTQFHEATDVVFACLSPEVIKAYVATKEPMDKAGGYGIQNLGGTLIEGIRGDYFNVMGFPLHKFAKEVSKLYSSTS